MEGVQSWRVEIAFAKQMQLHFDTQALTEQVVEYLLLQSSSPFSPRYTWDQ